MIKTKIDLETCFLQSDISFNKMEYEEQLIKHIYDCSRYSEIAFYALYKILPKHLFTDKVLKKCIKSRPLIFSYIENPSYEIQLFAVKQSGYNIKYIKKPDAKLQMASVKNAGSSLVYFKPVNKKIIFQAIKDYPLVIHEIMHYASLEMMIYAIQLNESVFEHTSQKDLLENPAYENNINNIKHFLDFCKLNDIKFWC